MRVILLVFDGFGCGAAPDAAAYGDEGSHTLANTARATGGLHVPVLERLGLGVVDAIPGVRPVEAHAAAAGLMLEQAAGIVRQMQQTLVPQEQAAGQPGQGGALPSAVRE